MDVICVKGGDKFSRDHVRRLRDSCAQHMILDEFHCITDDPWSEPDVTFQWFHPEEQRFHGWWAKMQLYSRPYWNPTLYLDLDVEVRAPFTVEHQHNRIGMPLDYLARYQPQKNIKYVNSSIQTLFGEYDGIWMLYVELEDFIRKNYRGDQEFLWDMFPKRIYYLDQFLSESYKWETRQRGYAKSPLVVYHGEDAKKEMGTLDE